MTNKLPHNDEAHATGVEASGFELCSVILLHGNMLILFAFSYCMLVFDWVISAQNVTCTFLFLPLK